MIVGESSGRLASLRMDGAGLPGVVDQDFSAEALFAYADRRCRTAAEPAAHDLLLRSGALRLLGHHAAAGRDLRDAFVRDADDVSVCQAVLAMEGDDTLRTEAAFGLLSNPRASDAALDSALQHLTTAGSEVMIRAERRDDLISGWIGWTSTQPPQVEWEHQDGVLPVTLFELPSHPFRSFPGRIASFSFLCDAEKPLQIVASGSRGGRAVARLYATRLPPFTRRETSAPGTVPPTLNVIVPLYRDAETVKVCLESLALQDCALPVRVYLVDDHSPEPEISALARRFCEFQDATLLVNRVNHGFAGAVNRALLLCEEGDVLLLNSDVTLPPGALDRLIRAAYSDHRIGTVMPLSNDSSWTSFPKPNTSNPLQPADGAIRIDDAARQVHGDAVADLVCTIGYCVYIKSDCLRKVGLISLDYGRGYFEDVEFALKAREKGFRNVAALGLYVSHASGRSFARDRSALISRNGRVACDRFPRLRLETETFVHADPLRAARGAIEIRLPPSQPTHLLVGAAAGPGSPIGLRARRIVEEGGFVLILSWRQLEAMTRIDIQALSGFGPHSLSLTLEPEGLDALSRYILDLRLVQIELCDLHTIPSPLYRLLLRTSAPILFFVASLEDALLVNSGFPQPGQERLTSRDITVDFLGFDRDADLFAYRVPQFLMRSSSSTGASKFVTSDSMAEAVCADLQNRAPMPAGGRLKPPVRWPARWEPRRLVAVPLPLPSAAVERMLVDLARHLRGSVETKLVVLGQSLDDRLLMATGNVHVTGPAQPEDYAPLAEAYGADALFLPYRTSLFGVLETLSTKVDLPRAYFDWSAGLMAYRSDDVVFDCRLAGDVLCSEFARWCAPIGSGSEVHP